MKDNQLRIKIGPLINKDFQIFLGDEDITKKLMVKSIRMTADADGGFVRVLMDMYADNVEIIPGELILRTEEWPPTPPRRGWITHFLDMGVGFFGGGR